jgi:SAM-dependent methyltransferase
MSEQHKHLIQAQFGASARAYVTSAVHAKGRSLERLLDLTEPQPGWRVLDIATGGGHTALAFAPHVGSVIATDLTRPMLLAAREHLDAQGAAQVAFCQADAGRLPFRDETFDCVTCRIAAHHFENAAAFVQEVVRVLVAGGVFALADNVVSGEPKVARFVNTWERLRDPSHRWAYSLDDWEAFCFAAGLDVTHRESYHKELDFDEWTARMNVGGDDVTRLRALLLQAPEGARAWLNPQEIGSRLTFRLGTGIVIGRKPASEAGKSA